MTPPMADRERAVFECFIFSFGYCWACGIDPFEPRKPIDRTLDYPRSLETHHICGGSGRSHDRRNLARLCKLCHDVLHGAVVQLAPASLKLHHVLWLKHRHDGPLDRRFLNTLRSRALPPMRTPPRWFTDQYETRRRRKYPCKSNSCEK